MVYDFLDNHIDRRKDVLDNKRNLVKPDALITNAVKSLRERADRTRTLYRLKKIGYRVLGPSAMVAMLPYTLASAIYQGLTGHSLPITEHIVKGIDRIRDRLSDIENVETILGRAKGGDFDYRY